MPGSKEGGKQAAQTNIERYGADFYKRIGSVGGKNGNTGGFKNVELARRAGRLGGSVSKRGPNKMTTDQRRAVIKKLTYLEEKHIDERRQLSALAKKWANR